MPLARGLGRILAEDVRSGVDVPGFDRSNVDGFAVQAADTFGAMEEGARTLALNDEVLATGVVPRQVVSPGRATMIATGAMVPRGADAVVMVEHTEVASEGRHLEITRAVAPGDNVSYAGTDIAKSETVLRMGQVLTSREIGVLAAIGLAEVCVFRQPQVAILSTGDEIVAPGEPLRAGAVYDSNAAIVGAAVEELGGKAIQLGIIADNDQALSEALARALQYDLVVLSGGTSKGAGDQGSRGLSDGQRLRLGHGVQQRGRVHHDRPAHGDHRRWLDGRGSAAWSEARAR